MFRLYQDLTDNKKGCPEQTRQPFIILRSYRINGIYNED